jgi:hypothetical protein
MSEEYIKQLEEENEMLRKQLADRDLIYDILSSKVTVQRTDFWNQIDPYAMAKYLESHGWKIRYEKEHERYLTRCYVSRKGDHKLKLFMKDSNPVAARRSEVGSKIRIAIQSYSSLHDKGELQTIFEVLKLQDGMVG